MGIVIPFRCAPSFECHTATKKDADRSLALVAEAMGACPTCTGRGVFPFRTAKGFLDFAPCPCGGTDEDRIDLPDFDGAA